MLNSLQKLFDRYLDPQSPGGERERQEALQVAAAALLIEVMQADYDVSDAERKAVTRAMRQTFRLSEAEAGELMHRAESEAMNATSLYQFTSLINDRFSYSDKADVIEQMWQVAYADGELDKYEEHLIRKVADLIYVSHSDFIRAKLRAAGEEGT